MISMFKPGGMVVACLLGLGGPAVASDAAPLRVACAATSEKTGKIDEVCRLFLVRLQRQVTSREVELVETADKADAVLWVRKISGRGIVTRIDRAGAGRGVEFAGMYADGTFGMAAVEGFLDSLIQDAGLVR